MFWTILKWGGSAVIALIVVLAFLNASPNADQPAPGQPDTPITNKKFNF